MIKNIFEDAKFGDIFVTKNGKPVIFSYISTAYNQQYAICLFENTHLTDRFELNGKSKDRGPGCDIVARY